jgi:hypothetical protein
MTAKDHNKLLSIFFFVHGGLQALGGIFITLIYGGMGTAMLSTARRSEEQTIGGIFLVLGVVIGIFVLLFAGFAFFTGWKLFKERSGARVLGIIASCVALLGFPLGTALGVYGLWFLLGEQGKQFYAGANATNNYPPPPPNNWQ